MFICQTTYSGFTAENTGKFFFTCDDGIDDDGNELLDVLAYDSQADLDADDDNSLCVARATVIDDRN